MTRIHENDTIQDSKKNIADHPENARYIDGYYSFKAWTKSILNKIDTVRLDSILLDNYTPYIRKVEISFDGSDIGTLTRTVDEKKLTKANDGTVKSSISTTSAIVSPIGDLEVIVTVSEPLDTLMMKIPKLNLSYSPTSQNGLVYTFSLTNVSLFDSTDTCLKLEFTGTDTNNNSLLNVAKKTNGNDGGTEVMIPKRIKKGIGSNKWIPILSDTGIDSLTICIGSCSGGGGFREKGGSISRSSFDCLDLFSLEENITNTTCGDSTGSIHISHPDLDNSYGIHWYDESGSVIEQYDGLFDLNNLEAGYYCYTMYNDDCCFERCITVGSYISGLDVILEVNEAVGSETSWAKVTMNGAYAPYTVVWTNSQDSIIKSSTTNDTDFSPFNLLLGETYCIETTNSLGCVFDDCFTITGTNCASGYKIELVNIDSTICGDNSGSIEIIVDTDLPSCFVEAGFDISWSNEDFGSVLSEIYAGEYCVTVTNLNEDACEGCKTVACFEVFDKDCKECEDPLIISARTEDICRQKWWEWDYLKYKEGYFYSSGLIEIVLEGGCEDYSIIWDDGDISGFERIIYDPGTYCATIYDPCCNEYIYSCWTIDINYVSHGCNSVSSFKGVSLEIDVNQIMAIISDNWKSEFIAVNNDLYLEMTFENTDSVSYDLYLILLDTKIGKVEMKEDLSKSIQENNGVNQILKEKSTIKKHLDSKVIQKDSEIITKVFPNPFQDQMVVEIVSNSNIQSELYVYDILGQKILSKYIEIKNGKNRFEIDFPSNTTNGIITISILSKGKIIDTFRAIKIQTK